MTFSYNTFALMGLGGPELMIIFFLILLLFGAKKLPSLARSVGRSMGEFKKAREEFEHEIVKGGEDADRERLERERLSALRNTSPSTAQASTVDARVVRDDY